MGASTTWGLPEGILSYPGFTGRSTQYHLGPGRLLYCRQELFLPQEAPLRTRAADHPSAVTIICLRRRPVRSLL